ncbi:Ribosomal RNA processing protein 1 like protein B [Tupaia chinensis]|uniref:Ribosomal RNA processing protein 1 like protein B n=1 Tax=Tupaia chinensis TaxID=246437 RepID=L8Y7J2_TUPCH|nr:Ribosomal RNA processing protein 1 like protein B [Tupaia chinensis]
MFLPNPPLQEELANTISQLIHVVNNSEAPLGKCHSSKDGISDEGEGNDYGALEDSEPLLQFDYKAIADRLLEITNRKNIPPFNRKRLTKLIKKFQELSEGGISQLSFAEDISADEDDQTLSQGRHKKKRNKLAEQTDLGKKANRVFLAKEEDSEGRIQKRKRKKKKKNHLQPENSALGDEAPSLEQNGNREPEASQRKANTVSVAKLGGEATSSTCEDSGLEHPPIIPNHSKRKRPKKKNLRTHGELWESTMSPPEGAPQNEPSRGHPQGFASRGSPTGGSQAPRRKRKLGALPLNGSGPAILTWPSASPVESGGSLAPVPPCARLQKKKAEPSSLDFCDVPSQKTAILKKRKKMREMSNLVEHNGVLESEVRQIQALGSSGTFGPVKKKPMRTENDFVKFDTTFSPKPLFFRKSKSSPATCSPEPAVQLSKTPSSSKKVTFGLNRNMTAAYLDPSQVDSNGPAGMVTFPLCHGDPSVGGARPYNAQIDDWLP